MPPSSVFFHRSFHMLSPTEAPKISELSMPICANKSSMLPASEYRKRITSLHRVCTSVLVQRRVYQPALALSAAAVVPIVAGCKTVAAVRSRSRSRRARSRLRRRRRYTAPGDGADVRPGEAHARVGLVPFLHQQVILVRQLGVVSSSSPLLLAFFLSRLLRDAGVFFLHRARVFFLVRHGHDEGHLHRVEGVFRAQFGVQQLLTTRAGRRGGRACACARSAAC